MAKAYLLNTNVLIDYFKGRPGSERLLADLSAERLAVSVITVAEFLEGLYAEQEYNQRIEKFFAFLADRNIEVYDIDLGVARQYARLQAGLGKAGRRAPSFDALIGAVAIAHHLTLVTKNRKDFQHMPELDIYSV